MTTLNTETKIVAPPSTLLGELRERAAVSQTVVPLIFAIVVGVGAGAASVLFRKMILWAHWLFFDQWGAWLSTFMGSPYPILVLALGGLLVGLITKFFAPEAKGHGVPEVMVAVAYRGGRIRPRVTIFKAIGAAITIGSGGSAGQEGPIVQIGAAFGSAVGQLFRFTDRRVTLGVACGAAGGIAATFNAPIAGVMFALEVILARFTSLTFGLVVISATTATVISRAFLGDNPAFVIPVKYNVWSLHEIVLFAVLGLLAAFVAQAYIWAIYGVEVAAEKIRMPDTLKPAVGGALVGAIGIFVPLVFGNGYDVITGALSDNFVLGSLVLLCLGKIVATALTVGSGGSGGVFAPALAAGATFGGAFGRVVEAVVPGPIAGPGAFALVGMAAVFGGAAHAPITAIFMIFEMTDNYHIILPLMTATVLSTFLCQKLTPDSMYTIKLRRRGFVLGGMQDVNLMDAISVRDAMQKNFESVSPDMPLTALILKLATGHYTGFPVIDKDGALKGIVTGQDVENALITQNPDSLRVKDICTKNVLVARPDQTLSHALALFGTRNIGRLPVVDPDQPGQVIGMLNRAGIVTAYAEAYGRGGHNLLRRMDEMRSLTEDGLTVVLEDTVTTNSDLAGTLVRDADFPAQSILVKISRAEHNIIPRGSTELQAGDTLVVLSTRRNARQVQKWLKEHC